MKLTRLFRRRIFKTLLWVLLILALAVAANLTGIYLFGSISDWQHWLSAAAGYFLVWRLCLYAATVYGWRWMRRRLLNRETGRDAHQRLIRAEIASVVAIVLLETSLLMQGD